ncbi:DUF2268 domain-containing protein, partial [Bacillaceae bacterium Marseille-Q3522]|nr:DUF2268 domain-containing protein [Bacillaceae bacterium Marseille-Q3522]
MLIHTRGNGGIKNGVERTDKWLEEEYEHPIQICKKIIKEEGKEAENLYRYLQKFGMYRPHLFGKKTISLLIEANIWRTIDHLYQKYRKKWNGPDIPVYIFPLAGQMRAEKKSGLSFPDKMFLFLTPIENIKELEALFIHEYHHICRMRNNKKKPADITLIDSLIMEGLAEHMVKEICGGDYLAPWVSYYSQEELEECWNAYVEKNLHAKKYEKEHDRILFGERGYPPLIGYAIGYEIIKQYKKKFVLSESNTFT